eukprot:CAMPEP_0170057662 /NCGR_PEP_ID=MMETSP0019_2-20121128/576_1 /TAXON_ID=98059 /ORGANISM="Dinobryon sp., Strain UTEXLB2267" /LENGTH=215 /DNA_ID=CAMNT_0010262409 /DNA_START=778 /DNA_END=1425 /DNA_ORIENTATION=-
MNREAMLHLLPAINNNALTRLQLVWGGSHDFVLGLLMWICDLPTFSFASGYYGMELLYVPTVSGQMRLVLAAPIEPSQHFVFHRLLNFKRFQPDSFAKYKSVEDRRRSKVTGEGAIFRDTIGGIYDLVGLLHEEKLYLSSVNNLSNFTIKNANTLKMDSILHLQALAGHHGASTLVLNNHHGVLHTVFGNKFQEVLPQHAVEFAPHSCRLHATFP